MGYTVAVIGATGNVGRELLTILAEREFPADSVVALASSRSIGSQVSYGEDDVLDVLTPQSILGKKQNSDVDKNKPTYPALLGLKESQKTFQKLYDQAQERLEALSVNADELQALAAQLHAREF